MTLFGSPAPQWTDLATTVASTPSRLVLFLDASGFWVLLDSPDTPSGAYLDDVSGFGIIDDTTTTGLRATLLPSDFVVTY